MTSVSLDRIAAAFGMNAPKETDSHQYATVDSINADGSYQVIMNGATSTVRAAKLCDAELGDRVFCVIHNGQVAAIGRVGGEIAPEPYEPTITHGTLTQVYSGYGFTLEADAWWAADNVVMAQVQFTTTQEVSWSSQTVASIPVAYAPPIALRFCVWVTNAWSTFFPAYVTVGTDGTIKLQSAAGTAWFGTLVWIKE